MKRTGPSAPRPAASAASPIEDVRDCVLSAAHWRAAREGLDRTLVDLRLGGMLQPAWVVVDELVATVSPALLRHGDIELVVTQLARPRSQGTGAVRRRRIHARTQDIAAVLADLARQTIEQRGSYRLRRPEKIGTFRRPDPGMPACTLTKQEGGRS